MHINTVRGIYQGVESLGHNVCECFSLLEAVTFCFEACVTKNQNTCDRLHWEFTALSMSSPPLPIVRSLHFCQSCGCGGVSLGSPGEIPVNGRLKLIFWRWFLIQFHLDQKTWSMRFHFLFMTLISEVLCRGGGSKSALSRLFFMVAHMLGDLRLWPSLIGLCSSPVYTGDVFLQRNFLPTSAVSQRLYQPGSLYLFCRFSPKKIQAWCPDKVCY